MNSMRLMFLWCILGIVWSPDLKSQSKKQNVSPAIKQLQADVLDDIGQKFVENASWGIVVQSLKNGETLVSVNPKKNLIPASNRKIFSSIFALDQLGADFTYVTQVFAKGVLDSDSVFTGDIIIRGAGDPTISGRFYENKTTKILEDWADSVQRKGIKSIRGRIIGDDNGLMGDDVLGDYWESTEESYWYSAQISGLNFNDNCVDWYVKPTRIGEPAKIILIPPTQYIKINNFVKTVSSKSEAVKVDAVRRRAANEVDFIGSILTESDPQHGYVTVENPTRYTAHVFSEILQSRNIRVDSAAVDADDLVRYVYNETDSNMIRIARYVSPAMPELMKIINKNSHNLYAELLWRTVAAVKDSSGTSKRALALEEKFLKSVGLNPDKISICDGSGYARGNLVSPQDIVTLLTWVRKHKNWKTFYESLPLAGEEGTVKSRMKGTLAEGNARAKTGYLDNVRTISGFVKTRDGEELVYSVMCNNFTTDRLEIDRIQDMIIGRLAFFTRN